MKTLEDKDKMDNKLVSKNDNLIESYLPFFLLFSQYKFGPITLGEIGLFFIVVNQIVRNHYKFTYSKNTNLTLLMVYVIARSLLNGLLHMEDLQSSVNAILEYAVICAFSVYVTNKKMNEERLYVSWKIAGVLYSAGLVYQIISLYFLGRGVRPISIVPGYTFYTGDLSFRPTSFFSEPAAYVCAMLPLVFLALKRKDYQWALGATLMIIASTSTVGIVLVVILWGSAFIQKGQSIGKRLLFLITAVIGLWAVFSLTIFSDSLNKLNDVMSGGSTVGSRIICGFDTIRTMDILEWFVGTSFNNSATYIRQHSYLIPNSSPVHLYMAAHGKIFMNTVFQIIFQYGLIGLFLYWKAIYSRLWQREYEAKPYLFMMLISIFGQSKFMNSIFFMELMLVLLYDRKDVRK